MNNELVPQPSWWKKNWKWVLPLGGCFTLIVIFIFFIGSIFYGVSSVLDKIQPYEYALEKINQDDDMINELGSPIEKDGPIQTNYNYINGKKNVKLNIPVSGPKNSGILFVEASGEGDDWVYDVIRVEIKDNENIDLLESEDF